MTHPAITWRALAILSLAGLVVAGSPLLRQLTPAPGATFPAAVQRSLLPAPIGLPLADRGPRGPRAGWLRTGGWPIAASQHATADPRLGTAEVFAGRSTRLQMARPWRLTIPRIGVDAAVDPLGLQDDGSVEVPADAARTGWWTGGPEPGEVGAAVILGHVDSYRGPGVFYALSEVTRGDVVLVDLVDGRRLRYVVSGASGHAKEAFPAREVYQPDTDDSLLRLITCGGSFDEAEGSYEAVIVVHATLIGVEQRPAGDPRRSAAA